MEHKGAHRFGGCVVMSPALQRTRESLSSGSLLALGISSDPRALSRLQEIFSRLGFRCEVARSYREAMRVLCARRMPLIFSDRCLPDGSWKDVLSLLAPLAEQHQLIVMAAPGDEGGDEVREMCGFEMLRKPIQEVDVVSVIARACPQWSCAPPDLATIAGAA